MSNILEAVTAQRNAADVKSALREIGCDVSGMDDLSDVAKIIREQCVTGPNAVINAKLMSGPGVKITPVDRKGYKISANSDAVLVGDLTDNLPAGTSLHKVLFQIVNKMIPDAVRQAAGTPSILSMEIFKAPYDGVDFYDNRAFGAQGQGRRAGLHPDEWYLKVYLYAQREPLYVSFGQLMMDFRKQLMNEVHHMVDHMIREAIREHLQRSPHHVVEVPVPTPPRHDHQWDGPDGPWYGDKPSRPCPPPPPPHHHHHDKPLPDPVIDDMFDNIVGRPTPPSCDCPPTHPNGPWKPECCPMCGEPHEPCKPCPPHRPGRPIPPMPPHRPGRPCPPPPPPHHHHSHPIDDDYIEGMFDSVVNEQEIEELPPAVGTPGPGSQIISDETIENMFDRTMAIADMQVEKRKQDEESQDKDLETLLNEIK